MPISPGTLALRITNSIIQLLFFQARVTDPEHRLVYPIPSIELDYRMSGTTSTSKERVNIALDGDMILDSDDTEIKISSTLLKCCSPVFSTMLGPNFSEGKEVSKENPGHVALQGDDTAALVVI